MRKLIKSRVVTTVQVVNATNADIVERNTRQHPKSKAILKKFEPKLSACMLIGRLLNVHHQSVINWVNAYAVNLPEAPTPEEVDAVEMDELYTFIGEKKTEST